MDTGFFLLAKVIGLGLMVETWGLAALGLAGWAVWRGHRRLALRVQAGLAVALLALELLPLGEALIAPLERPYPPRSVMTGVDGIILLGGFESATATQKWGTAQLNEGADRVIAAAALARANPAARILIAGTGPQVGPTGGIGGAVLLSLGIGADRILWDATSRNTAENARNSIALLGGPAQGRWVLVTSAFHMDRALRSFSTAGWPGLIAFPVDHRSGSGPGAIFWELGSRVDLLNTAIKEWVGRIGYRLTGR